MALAAMDRQDPVYLLGFDLGPDSLGRFNNVYAGTEFYKPVGDRPTFSGNWVRQMVKIAADFPHQQFVRVQGATSAAILDFDRSPNIRSMAMQEFLLAINKVEET
jgi:hypothetical protein